MHYAAGFLTLLGANGPALLVASLLCGILLGPAAAAAYHALPVSAFLLTLGSFLAAGLSTSGEKTSPRLTLMCCLWAGFAVPALAAAAMHLLPLDPRLEIGVLLAALAPPVGSAAAIAAMLGLIPRLALVCSVTLTLLSPLLLPALSVVFSTGFSVDVTPLVLRLVAIVVTAAAIAALILRFRTWTTPLLPDARAAAGIAVLGLIIIGVTTTHNLAQQWQIDAGRVTTFVVAAVCANLVTCAVSALLFAGFGRTAALTVGLVSGNRNITLAWAAASATLPPIAQTYVAASVVPILLLPLVLKWLLKTRSAQKIRTANQPSAT